MASEEKVADARRRAKERFAALAHTLTRQEWLLIALVVACYGFFIAPAGTNTLSRYDMVQALAHGTAIIDAHAANTIDVSYFNGHYYSPRSIGLSLVAVPVLFVVHALEAALHAFPSISVQIGFLSLFTVLPAAVAGVIAFERFVLRMRPQLAGTPYPVIVTGAFALGTTYYVFAAQFLSHAFAGGLVMTGFYLLFKARTHEQAERLAMIAGALIGLSVISEYLTAVVALVLCVYVWAAFPGRRARMLLRFCLGAAPFALVLGWYDWFAFGNPLHLSYDYVAGAEFSGQHQGLFGITFPRPGAYWELVVWPRGLLVESPLLVLVPLGFARWWRSTGRIPLEALVSLVLTVLYVSCVASYFLPMGGENLPAPRLLVPMLPFACLALAWVVDDARRWLRAVCAALMAFGIMISFLWVALGSREYHTYLTYPVRELFVPLLLTGKVPHANGDTPPNFATEWAHLPHGVSIYLVLVPLLAWVVWALRQMWARRVVSDVQTVATATSPAPATVR